MFKKMNAKKLAIIFIVLAVIVLIIKISDSKKGERTFRKELFDIDTAQITSIIIESTPKGKKDVILSKQNNAWIVNDNDIVFGADADRVRNLLQTIENMKPERIAANNKKKWAKFEIGDSLGYYVKLKSDNKLLANLIIGKFSFKQQTRKMTSFVRLADEEVVYAVDGFLRMSFQRQADGFKNKTIISANKNNFTKLKFNYSGDSSFVINKQGTKWMIDGLPVDSASVDQYLAYISHLAGNEIAKPEEINKSLSPAYSLIIEGNNQSVINVNATYADSANVLISSNQNEGISFKSAPSGVFSKIFVNKQQFFAKKDVEAK